MNIHHLELFFYVARHGGISAAVRHMPYGIQQPAVSSQILQLEQQIGAKLFDRSPFKLTAEGEDLYGFVRPFFENIDTVAARLGRNAGAQQLRVGASELLLRDHLPAVIQGVRKTHPRLRLMMRTGSQAQIESMLRDRQIDIAFITALQTKPPPGFQCLQLARVPLVLLVPKKSKIKSAAELWARDRIEEPLISLPAPDGIFQRGLKKLRVDWPPSIEATSLELVAWYVANGYGIGVGVAAPWVGRDPRVRALALDGFDPVETVALWNGKPTPLIQSVLDESRRYVAAALPALAHASQLKGES